MAGWNWKYPVGPATSPQLGPRFRSGHNPGKARAAGGGISITVNSAALQRRAVELGQAPKDLKREIRKRMKKIGVKLQQEWRSEFVGQMTDRDSRRRNDGLAVLGTFSGKGKRTITVRTKFPNPKKPGVTVFKTFVGPRGGAGIPGPGFYLAFHEYGSVKHPRRPLANLVRKRNTKRTERELSVVIHEILRGW